MFCIAAFIVLAILALFSASYRPLAAKAWHCVIRRVTLRPCDIDFSEEVKGKLLGGIVLTHPRLARFPHRYIDWLAFAFVLLSVWSLVYVLVAGLNLWVYDTCTPAQAESCSLSGEACGVDQSQLSLSDALKKGEIGTWAAGPFVRFGETVSRIPDRLKTWHPEEYIAPTTTYARPFDPAKPTVVEIVDPSCKFCRKLTGNLLQAGVQDRANLTYVLYPIPTASGGTKFPHSMLMAQYLEATKQVPLQQAKSDDPPGDWQLLEKIFAQEGPDATLQERFVLGFTAEQAVAALRKALQEIGYTASDIERIEALAEGKEVAGALQVQRRIVEEQVRTIKIPTLLIDGRRYDRVVDVETLKGQ